MALKTLTFVALCGAGKTGILFLLIWRLQSRESDLLKIT